MKLKFKSIYTVCLLFILLVSCSVKPKPIQYGTDVCHFCTMTIVDKVHAAQVVTKKGKVYSFDAIECMINYLHKMNDEDIALFLTNELDQPEELIDAKSATYIRCEAIPSPMGEYLSAFGDQKSAQKILEKEEGKMYNWEELNSYFLNR